MKKTIRIGVLLLILLSAVIIGCVSQLPQSDQPQAPDGQSEGKVGEFTADEVIKMTWEYFYGADKESMPKLLEGKVIRIKGRVAVVSDDSEFLWLGPLEEDWKEYSNYGTRPEIKVFSKKPGVLFGEIKVNDDITLEGIFYPRSFNFEIK